MNRRQFYQGYRKEFENKLTQGQVNGFEAVFDYWEGLFPDVINTDFFQPVLTNQLAYVLSTIYHETGKTMEPVREGFAKSDEQAIRIVTRMYEQGRIKFNYAAPAGPYRLSYFGRGLIQLTWWANYQRVGEAIGLGDALEKNPSLALDLNISVKIAIEGMGEGLFTGKKLDDYINHRGTDYINARRIVNGLDRASLIAGYAQRFEKIINEAQEG